MTLRPRSFAVRHKEKTLTTGGCQGLYLPDGVWGFEGTSDAHPVALTTRSLNWRRGSLNCLLAPLTIERLQIRHEGLDLTRFKVESRMWSLRQGSLQI